MSDILDTPFDSSFGRFDIADLGANIGLGTECVDTENTAWLLLTPSSTPALDPTAWRSYNEPSPHWHGALANNLASQDSQDSQELELAQAAQEVPQVPQVPQASQVRLPFALRRFFASAVPFDLCTMRSLSIRWRRSSHQPRSSLATSPCD